MTFAVVFLHAPEDHGFTNGCGIFWSGIPLHGRAFLGDRIQGIPRACPWGFIFRIFRVDYFCAHRPTLEIKGRAFATLKRGFGHAKWEALCGTYMHESSKNADGAGKIVVKGTKTHHGRKEKLPTWQAT